MRRDSRQASPKLTLYEIVLGAIVLTLVSGLVGAGLLFLAVAELHIDGLLSLGWGGVVGLAVAIGLGFLLYQYYGNRQLWR